MYLPFLAPCNTVKDIMGILIFNIKFQIIFKTLTLEGISLGRIFSQIENLEENQTEKNFLKAFIPVLIYLDPNKSKRLTTPYNKLIFLKQPAFKKN